MTSERDRKDQDLLGRSKDTADADAAGFFPDLLRKGLSLGFTGFFMTEEAIRRALGDSVPRDVIEFVLEQSNKTRAELLDRLSREFGRTLQALDPVELARRLLDGRTIEISAQVRFVPEAPEDGTAVKLRVAADGNDEHEDAPAETDSSA